MPAKAKRRRQQTAGKLSLDAAAFKTCLDAARHGAQIHEDIRAGTSAGADGTPSLFVNGRFLTGNRSVEAIAAIIDEELKAK